MFTPWQGEAVAPSWIKRAISTNGNGHICIRKQNRPVGSSHVRGKHHVISIFLNQEVFSRRSKSTNGDILGFADLQNMKQHQAKEQIIAHVCCSVVIQPLTHAHHFATLKSDFLGRISSKCGSRSGNCSMIFALMLRCTEDFVWLLELTLSSWVNLLNILDEFQAPLVSTKIGNNCNW